MLEAEFRNFTRMPLLHSFWKPPPSQETWLRFARWKATSSAAQQETPPSMARVTQADARCRGHLSLPWLWNLNQQVGTLDALSKGGGARTHLKSNSFVNISFGEKASFHQDSLLLLQKKLPATLLCYFSFGFGPAYSPIKQINLAMFCIQHLLVPMRSKQTVFKGRWEFAGIDKPDICHFFSTYTIFG